MATGDKYEGDWLNGKKNGFGIFLFIQVITYLLMEMFMKENFRTEIVKEKENTHGQMRVFMKENGFATK